MMRVGMHAMRLSGGGPEDNAVCTASHQLSGPAAQPKLMFRNPEGPTGNRQSNNNDYNTTVCI
jgi:hypothetical protein